MRLSREQVRRLRNGDVSSLDFPYNPTHPDHGRPSECCVILEWEPERRLWDQASGQIVTVPRQRLMWLEVVAVKRHRKGHWRVQFSVTDLRHKPLYLGAGGAYTTSRFRAIDELEVIPRKDQERYAKTAYERDAAVRLERATAGRGQWKRARESARRQRRALERCLAAA